MDKHNASLREYHHFHYFISNWGRCPKNLFQQHLSLSLFRASMWSQILLRAYTKEMIRVYLEVCSSEGRHPDLNTFLNWMFIQVKNKFINFIFKMLWIHLLACELFRFGCRRNNKHCRIAAEKRMDPLIYQAKHYNYQQACLERDYSRLCLNPKIRK